MRTVNELAKLTGISTRTLHYYDEIGLLTPTSKSEAGYRLYDDKALEVLQQILFFKEFDIPLKEIKAVLNNPALDRNSILQMQKSMLVSKKERVEHLIASIDEILKGENKMDFTVFDENEIRAMYADMEARMNEEQKQVFIDQCGSMEAFKEAFLKNAATPQAQKNFAQVVEWYGSKEAALKASRGGSVPANENTRYQKRIDEIQKELAKKNGTDVNAPEIRALVEEYIELYRKLFEMEDVTDMMLEMAEKCQTSGMAQRAVDSIYGAGSTKYMGRVIEAYYGK